MKKRIQAIRAEVDAAESVIERHMAYVGLFRIILQHASIVLAEIVTMGRRNRGDNSTAQPPIANLLAPSDGTLVSTLCDLSILAENELFQGISRPLWKVHSDERPCWRLLEPTDSRTVERLLSRFVSHRNDGLEGHGLLGENDTEAESDCIGLLLDALSAVLPNIADSGDSFYMTLPDGAAYSIKTLRPYSGHLICYRSIRRVATGKCMVVAQIEKGPFGRQEISYEIDDPFDSIRYGAGQKYEITKTYFDDWSPFILFPGRLTAEFTGREGELEELADWANDTDSRACMLYGDGGMGKTTLAVEFVHRLLDGSLRSNYRPEVITFYTAKKTRWGINGLEIIRLSEVGIADVATLIPRALDGQPLDKTWFSKDAEQVIQKLSNYLVTEWGITRDTHLLVIDNTETMASNAEEVKILARQLRELSRRVGRVLLTSRRREAIEAHQIEIKKLSEIDSVKFLRARAAVLNRRPILDAGDRTLIKYSNNLGNKPLVLEVFVGALGEHGIGLENAFQRVQRMHSQDLGEFLYADAWQRISTSMQHLLLLMTRVSEIHDDTLLKLCCAQTGVAVVAAYEALEESRGIAQISTFENDTQILFSPEFLKFCGGRTINVDGTDVPTSNSVDKVRTRYNEFLRSRAAKISDRIDRAYRHALARAAYTAYREGRDEDCAVFYELAVGADNNNGWLFDRYAVFLSAKYPARRAEALDWAKKATQLIPSDADAWFTRGIIEGRERHVTDALISLARAMSLGKAKHLCLLQMASAHMRDTPPNKALARATLAESRASEPKHDPLLWKYRAEADSLERGL
ncbi:ATP-binding protein [Cupriavidus malaysiensis]|uniref:ATP-binding protein n=1 Tax=Cupriavidus malaysiensis TaxID=367825 RepID=UPI0012FFCFB6|nr:ATP-binding protein [Cupriavidus malaysiensis]